MIARDDQPALDAFVRRWSSARPAPEVYARRVVVNLAKDRWRTQRRRPSEAPLEADVPIPVRDEVADRDQLLRAARQLPAGQRAVLVRRSPPR